MVRMFNAIYHSSSHSHVLLVEKVSSPRRTASPELIAVVTVEERADKAPGGAKGEHKTQAKDTNHDL